MKIRIGLHGEDSSDFEMEVDEWGLHLIERLVGLANDAYGSTSAYVPSMTLEVLEEDH